MLELGEIFPTVAKENRAVELGVAADKVIVAGIERLAARFAPCLLGSEMAFQENCARIARFGDRREPLAALQDSDRCAASREPGRDRRAADARADNDDVRILALPSNDPHFSRHAVLTLPEVDGTLCRQASPRQSDVSPVSMRDPIRNQRRRRLAVQWRRGWGLGLNAPLNRRI